MIATISEFDENSIAIIGMAGRFPGASDINEYWQNLRDGVESIRHYSREELLAAGVPQVQLDNPGYVNAGAPLEDMECFDPGFFGFSPREAEILDPQHRHFLELCWTAFEDAGHDPARFDGPIAVYGGSGHNAYMPYNLFTNPQLMDSVGLFLVRHTGNDKDFMVTRTSYCFNLTGPAINVQTACSTSLVAIHLACQSLLSGESDMALAGGVTIELPHRQGYQYEEGEILSPDGHCRPFDADSKGTVFGSGGGVVLLRPLAEAYENGDHIHAVIRGSAINNDGAGKVGYLAPSVGGQAACIAEALAVSGVEAEEISYVETHGTGTPVGDPIEIAALTQAFGEQTDKTGFCSIGSVKSNIGHTDTAAGVASLIKTVMALKHRQLPPTLHFTAPNPDINFDNSPFRVNANLIDWNSDSVRRAGVSSLGVGGTNAHLIVEEAPELPVAIAPERSAQLLTFSARSPEACHRAMGSMADHLRSHASRCLADVAFTLHQGRANFPYRVAIVSEQVAAAADQLQTKYDQGRGVVRKAQEGLSTCFMFAGGGAQYPNMGADLYRKEPVYRQELDQCLALLQPNFEVDLKEILFPGQAELEQAAALLEQASIGLPLLFACQYAQAKLWLAWGVTPTAMIGHSMGEYTAACLAGVFSLADALALVVLRGQLFEQVDEGGMLSVNLPADLLAARLDPGLSIAAENGPELSVASGSTGLLQQLERQLRGELIECSRIHIRVAAHSSMLEPILEPFRQRWSRVQLSAPQLPVVSNLTGDWLTAEQATDAEYWVAHLRNTVKFADGVERLKAQGDFSYLEVGPGRTLASLVRSQVPVGSDLLIINSQRHVNDREDDQLFMLNVLAQLWQVGVDVDLQRLNPARGRRRVSLPTYSFDKTRYWIEPGSAPQGSSNKASLDKQADIADWFYKPVWQVAEPLVSPIPRLNSVLVFTQPAAEGLASELLAGLKAESRSLILVGAGNEFSVNADGYTVRADSLDDHQQLVAALSSRGVVLNTVVNLWGLAAESSANPETAIGRFFNSPVYFVRALADADIQEPMKWVFVTAGLHAVADDNQVVADQALILGPCRVIPTEFPHISCCNLDLPLRPRDGVWLPRLVKRIVAEVASPSSPSVVAIRGDERWVEEFQRAPLAEIEKPDIELSADAAYVITGGLGGLGLTAAKMLASRGARHLALVSRRPLPSRSEWSDVLGDDQCDQNVRALLNELIALELIGARLHVFAADVADRDSMAAVIAELKTANLPIRGVIHAAGTLEDGVIQLKEPGAAEKVLRPKYLGARVLEEVLQGESLDFIVYYSSVSSMEGLVGQVDYAAANACLDACARQQRLQGNPAMAINWTTWQQVGMAARIAADIGLQPTIEAPLGLARLASDSSWLLDDHRSTTGTAVMPGSGFVDFVYKTVNREIGWSAIDISELMFTTPLVAQDGEPVQMEMQLIGEMSRDQPVPFRLVSRISGELVEHASGYFSRLEEQSADQDWRSLLKRCGLGERKLAGRVVHPNLRFGPRWQNIETIYYGVGEALIHLRLPAEFGVDLVDYPLHPAMLDMATGSAQELITPTGATDEALYVPLSYPSIRIFAPLTGELFSHVVLRAGTDVDTVEFDVTISSADGTVLVKIAGYTMRRVQVENFAAVGETEALVPEVQTEQGMSAGNRILEIGLSAGILPNEGAEALWRCLNWLGSAQVIVSPQPFESLLKEIRLMTLATDSGPDSAEAESTARSTRPVVSSDYQPVAGGTEKLIASIWGKALGIAEIGRNDNFFELGGHSLLLTQTISRVRKAIGKSPAISALFAVPTIASWAKQFDDPSSGEVAVLAPVRAVDRSAYLLK